MNRMDEDLWNLEWNWPKWSQQYGLTGARLSTKLFGSSAQNFSVVLPVIPLESFQVSATVTEMGILAFPCRIEKSFAVVSWFISHLFIWDEQSPIQLLPQVAEFVLCSASGIENPVGFTGTGNLRLDLQTGNLKLDPKALPETMVNASLGDYLAVGQKGCSCGHLTPIPRYYRVFCRLDVDYDKFPKAMGEEALGSCPLALGSQGCCGNAHFVLKAMFLRCGLVSSYLLT